MVFSGIPNFAPEILKRVRVKDPLKQKHLRKKALKSLGEEGVTQVFKPVHGGDLVVGAVGALQFDVLDERMKAEYTLPVDFEMARFSVCRWISADSPAERRALHRGASRRHRPRPRRRPGVPGAARVRR